MVEVCVCVCLYEGHMSVFVIIMSMESLLAGSFLWAVWVLTSPLPSPSLSRSLCYTIQRISQRVVGHRVRGSVCMGLFDWCKNVSDIVTLVCGKHLCDIVPLFDVCV